MNRLTITQRLCREAGISSTGPSTTLAQTGEYAKAVNWVDDAYRDILNMHHDWQFLRNDFSFDTSDTVSEYSLSDVSMTDLTKWITDDVRCYLTAVSNEQEIFICDWEEFKRTYIFGSARTQAGRPSQFTIKPDKSMAFWPVPDDTYTIVGEYYKQGDDMALDATEPVLPSRFHMVIVWRALVYYGADYVEHDRYEHGRREYQRILAKLQHDQLPEWGWGDALC